MNNDPIVSPAQGETWFTALGESVDFGVFVYRGNRFLYTNAATTRILGYTAEELARLPVTSLLESETVDRMPNFDRDLGLFPPFPEPIELAFRHQNGNTGWISVTNTHAMHEGEVVAISTAVDITQRIQEESTSARRLALENALTDISRRFLSSDASDLDQCVAFALDRLGSSAGACCTSLILLENDEQTVRQEFWRGAGRVEGLGLPKRTLADFSLSRDELLAEEIITLNDVAIVDVNGRPVCQHAKEGNSYAATPLVSRGRLLGVLGHGWNVSPPPIDEVDLRFLRVGAGIFSSAYRRVAVERKLRQIQNRYEMAQLAGRSVAWEWHPDTDAVIMPVSAASIYGFGPEVIPKTGRALNDRVHPEDRTTVEDAIRESLRTGELYTVEHRYLLPEGGGTIWISARGRPIVDADGHVEKLVGVSADITEYKRVEQALEFERERAEVTLASLGDGVIRCDASGLIDYLNPAAETLTGWSCQEAVGKRLDEVYQAMEDGTGRLRSDPLAECLRQNRTVTSPEWCSLFQRGGAEFAVRDSASPIRHDDGTILGAVLIVKDVTRVRGLEREMAYNASHDVLTGLLNRREFENRVREALTNAAFTGRNHALCYLDLDAFKVVNDTCGHSVGDQMLQELSAVLEATARGTDILARLGGDEFGLLLTDCSVEEARERADAFLQAVRNYRFLWRDRFFEVGVSIGIVPVTRDSPRYNELISASDAACFVAKEQGRNRIHISHFEDAEVASRHHEARWVERVNRAIDGDEFRLFRQDIFPLQDRSKPTLVELLLRLPDGDEIISPNRFIPAAERYRLMPRLDLWVIRDACRYIRNQGAQNDPDDTVFSINLSGQSISDPMILDAILEELDGRGLNPAQLCFEITETAAISNLASAHAFIGVLRERGCSFALDDFGSGLSSFRYLKDLQVNYLKIDGSLVTEVAESSVHREMVAAIRRIGLAMGLVTIGEWVETEASLKVLKQIGLDYAQGFLFGEPTPIESPETPHRGN